MKKYFIIYILSFVFGQNFIPENNFQFNQTQIFFKWPQINKASNYIIHFNNDEFFFESELNSTIIEGFNWGQTYSWDVCGIDQYDEIIRCYDENYFTINNLHENYPSNVAVLEIDENQYQDGITLLDYESLNFSTAVDKFGSPVWFSNNDNFSLNRILATQFLENGNIVGFAPGIGYEFNLNSDILFETSNDFDIHHSIQKTKKDTYFFIDAEIQQHPCPEECDPEYPDIISWLGDRFIEVDSLGNILWEWSTFDYLSIDEYNPKWVEIWMAQWDFGGNPTFDWTHSNSVYYDEDLDIIFISIRNLSRITAIDYNTKQIIWNMGVPDFMETVYFDDNFDFSHQHSVQVTNDKNIIFFDNGRDKVPELSRCIEISYNENFEAELIWEHVLSPEMLTLSRGECDRLNNDNTLISAGRTGNVIEVNHDNEIVWHLSVKENNVIPVTVYRSERIKNLYPNVFSFKINNLFGSYDDNYQIESNSDSLNIDIYNQGWISQKFVYELLDENQNVIFIDEVYIDSSGFENVNLNLNLSHQNYILKIYPFNDINSYQLVYFNNNFLLGDINDDMQINIQDIILIINLILDEDNYLEIADLNQDNGISILDVVLLINHILES
tara:strand:- start:3063 stop:4898 length:1836 start_codon:yes stop_codon:yes gene_type:complete